MYMKSFTHVIQVDASRGHSASITAITSASCSAPCSLHIGWALLLSAILMIRPPTAGLSPYSTFLLDATEAAGFSCQAEIT